MDKLRLSVPGINKDFANKQLQKIGKRYFPTLQLKSEIRFIMLNVQYCIRTGAASSTFPLPMRVLAGTDKRSLSMPPGLCENA